jgi:hypothetical protein
MTRTLEIIGQISQISLAVVAIFGYFYTVQPIYQKERLAEQVAEYDGIIKKQAPKIAEIELNLATLQRERAQLSDELQHERERLTGEMKNMEHLLSLARQEKQSIENQIQYMTFRYRLPDGSPAVTSEQVKTAKTLELKRSLLSLKASFLSSLAMSCTLFDRIFVPHSVKTDRTDKIWPFNEQEIIAWKEYNTKYPMKRARECIDSVASNFLERYKQTNYLAEIESFRRDAVQYADRAGSQLWTPPVQPADIWQELAATRTEIQTELTAELKKVEEEYGDWEAVFGDSRREIFKHNYHTLKRNAEMKSSSKQLSLDYKMQEKANTFRKSINEEIKRLIISENKDDKDKL